ncbi:MAG: HlyD family efflux transporter periplasmic adaptor subunit, partial [Planctomycetia bacterium]|nr:HlyD family efflux transporter periplasmic adaptor subunit [Planctomycetia bacterium]
MLRNGWLPVVSLVCLALAGYHVAASYPTVGQYDPPIAPAVRPFGAAVAGVGMIEPCSQNLAVAAPVSGVVAEVFVQVGQSVQAGAPLFRLDDRAARAELKVRAAGLAAAAAQVQRQESLPRAEEVPVVEARLREAQAGLADQEEQLARARLLYQRRALSEEEHRRREHAVEVAQAQAARARAELDLLRAGGWKADETVLRAASLQALAQKQQAETEVERCTVRAPIAGTVLQLNVRPGEFVGTPPGQPLLVLGDVSRLHVRVDVDENDIGRLQP